MKNLTKSFLLFAASLAVVSCSNDDSNAVANNVTLKFINTFKDKVIVLGDASSSSATVNKSAEGQEHQFSELKYVISNIRLIKNDGKEIPYHVNDLDKGATVVNQAKAETLNYLLTNIPRGEYKQIKFGLGVRSDLNVLDQIKFPVFYANAGANDTEMMWEWGTGYRFTKIEGFYDADKKQMSIHTGSTLDDGDNGELIQGVDAYREVVLNLPTHAVVGSSAPTIKIKADFDKLLTGKSNTIKLSTGKGPNDNATPNIHTAVQMVKFVDNLGGNGTSDVTGMFSIISVK
ncbi:MbnP family protein [Myroides odoratimimus]|uniref:MbnP family protein n=1 Tax=Myroides odoratimimus TaxID=76832 RepID=UPI002DB691B4|nr:MbnP family protein [Myroides odoratimimus]MEC4054059.1 MbnP family protein [Myroides odoratimimus]